MIEQVGQVPEILLRKLISKKLEENGISNKGLAEAFTKHVLENGDAVFQWDDGKDDASRNVSLHISQDELDEVVRSMEKFLKDGLPELFLKTVQHGAKLLVKGLKSSWPEVKLSQSSEFYAFQGRLELRWSAGLDPLRMMLTASREIGEEYASRLSRSKAKRGIVTRQTLVMLHVRACQTTMEVITLLECGFADGAYARWRTLYEIAVVAMLIDRVGDELAERYLAHDAVSIRDALVNEFSFNDAAFHYDRLDKDQREIEDRYREVLDRYGSSFASPYGWAAHYLKVKKPTFQSLEKAIDWNSLPPDYKWSSHKVHAGASGLVRSLGLIGDRRLLAAGASNAGLERPAGNTAYSLLHITSLLVGKTADIDSQIKLQALILLRDEVIDKCGKIARRLIKEELSMSDW